ncbi:CHAT domain-containing tetratricopeptide repeat protein [Cognataquiflexum aquatile]|uniref:CHAT domain-containing tetratricopeptide repeat protein n=1 Tax=Cognataquiflexum aquatile TaxID=2249427 RepID=UPI000DEA94A7|nr:CHAT domain-containing protein [Cognataquiflexum aquatile]
MFLIRAHNELVIDLAACKNEMQVIDKLHEKRDLVDGIFLRLFMDTEQNNLVKQKIKPSQRFNEVTKLVQEQYTRNLIDEYLRTPEEYIPFFVRPVIRVLILEYSFNYISSLLVYYENDVVQTNHIIERFGMLIGIAIDYLFYVENKNLIKEMLYAGPSFFINSLDLLNKKTADDSSFKHKSIYLIQLIADYKGRFPIEQIIDQRLIVLLNTFFSIDNEEEKIAIIQKALSIAKNESLPVKANLQYILGSSYLNRLVGLRSDNLREAMNCLNKALQFYTKQEDIYKWSALQNAMGRVYVFWQKGVTSENIEKAIEFFNNALEGFTRETAPYDWALQQNNLGSAYLERMNGNKRTNIERAIEYFQQALTIQTSDDTPDDWAMTMMNLGDAFNNKYGAERSDDAQTAIGFYEKSLTIYTREGKPVMWAKVKTKLGDAYHTMATNNRSENLKKAFAHVSDALTVLKPSSALQEWVISQCTLARIFIDRIDGERIENIEQAIALYESVLHVDTKEQSPYSWAINSLNLAHCYRVRLRGNRLENQEKAIANLHLALQVLNKKQFPIDWASVQHLLGIIYYERIATNKALDYEKAIGCFESALEVRTKENVPNSWIESLNSLGNTYRKRVLGNPIQNIENAKRFFLQILQSIKVKSNPMLWAIVNYNAGLTHRDSLKGDSKDNFAQAIDLFKKALTVHTPVMNPIECFKTAVNLGKLYYSMHKYADAKSTLELCHQSIENMRAQSIREISRMQLASESENVYEVLVASCLMTGNIDDAFYYTTAAKARLFTDKMGGEAKKPIEVIETNPEFTEALAIISSLRFEIDRLTSQRHQYQDFLSSANGSIGNSPAEIVAEKRRVLAKALEELFYNFPQLQLNDAAPIAKPEAVKKLSAKLGNIPLVEFYKSIIGWGAFIVVKNSIVHIELEGVSKELVESIVHTMLEYEHGVIVGKSPELFINQLAISLGDLYNHFLRPLEVYLPANGPLVLAASHDLHLLPFTIAYDQTRHKYLVDQYTISFMPSLGALENLHRRMELSKSYSKDLTMLSVAYSAKDTAIPLNYAMKEAKEVASHYLPEPHSVYLYEQDATPVKVLENCHNRQFNTVHFSCHGQFNVNDPANSGLLLKGGMLTVERIATELRQKQFPMIILSACQSGISLSQDGDESIGLIQSFFNAGAGSVISGQWSVEDRATQVLFGQFCENRKTMNGAESLRQAMITIKKNQQWNSPIYWGAFKMMGLS